MQASYRIRVEPAPLGLDLQAPGNVICVSWAHIGNICIRLFQGVGNKESLNENFLCVFGGQVEAYVRGTRCGGQELRRISRDMSQGLTWMERPT